MHPREVSWKRGPKGPHAGHVLRSSPACALAAALLALCTPAFAQDEALDADFGGDEALEADDALGDTDVDSEASDIEADADENTDADDDATDPDDDATDPDDDATDPDPPAITGAGAGVIASMSAGVPDPEQKNGFVSPRKEAGLSWGGSLEVDVGNARYTFESAALNTEEVYDFRGRFVLAPTFVYEFWDDWFMAARGEAVLWVREQFGVYQVNVDDVFAQVGKHGVWDFKVGRFRTWRVYHRGLGFDLFTLEDSGACVQNPCTADAGTFGPRMYEVNYTYDRETAGRGALHVYPTEWSGLELATTYGQSGVSNTWGVRGAGMIHFEFVRVMAAAEFRAAQPREEASALDPDGNMVACEKCGVSERMGFGGGIELTLPPFELGVNAARGTADIYTVTTGAFDEGGSNTLTTLGGYAELDVGSLTFDRSLIVGFGLNRTEALAVNENFSEHLQMAAYLAYPLGFNGAMVKLVASRADLEGLTLVDSVNRVFNESKSAMTAARVRLVYPF